MVEGIVIVTAIDEMTDAEFDTVALMRSWGANRVRTDWRFFSDSIARAPAITRQSALNGFEGCIG
jgi:hypothetical protein